MKHTSGSFCLLLLFCTAWLPQPASAAEQSAEQVKEYKSVVYVSKVFASISIDSLKRSYQLPHQFIFVHSESCFVNDSLLSRDKDYSLDYNSGTLTFARLPVHGTSVTIHYLRFPYEVPQSYYLYKIDKIYNADDMQELPVIQQTKSRFGKRDNTAGENLELWGSKSFGVSVGSRRDLAIEQALDINIHGSITKDVKVTASLTDQQTPIPPEGNTQVLQEIDGVLIKVEGPHLGINMGNIFVNYGGTEFSNYEKRLEGAHGSLHFPTYGFSISGAGSEGEFTSTRLLGIEGNQGPYFLRLQGIKILPGTERVWIDGELMTRGSNNDYVIEYGNGSIEFTHKRLITNETRIVVDYEYSQDEYRKNVYSGQAYVHVADDRFRIRATVIQEKEDKNSPRQFILQDAAKSVLEQSGDDPRKAFLSGIIADTTGDYFYQFTDSTKSDSFLNYDPFDSVGAYSVFFTYVGEDSGDYVKNPDGRSYRYVGKKTGNYQPLYFLPLPKDHVITDMTIGFNPVRSVQITNELALSSIDLNTFSNADDGDNAGIAYTGAITFTPKRMYWKEYDVGAPLVRGAYRIIEKRFRSIGRLEEIEEYDRTWNVSSVQNSTLEIWKGELVHSFLKRSRAGATFGKLTQRTISENSNLAYYFSIDDESLPQLSGKLEQIRNTLPGTPLVRTKESFWERKDVRGSYILWKLVPNLSYNSEYYVGSLERNFEGIDTSNVLISEYNAGLASRGLGVIGTSVSFKYRSMDIMQNKYNESFTSQVRFALRDWHTFSQSMELTRRELLAYPGKGQRTASTTNLINLESDFSPYNRALMTDVTYRVKHIQSAQKFERYYFVGQGKGSYMIDTIVSGDTLFRPAENEIKGGDYIRNVENAPGKVRPAIEVGSNVSIHFQPRRLINTTGKSVSLPRQVLNTISTTSLFTLDKRSNLKSAGGFAIYFPEWGALDTSRTIRENKNFRQDIMLAPEKYNTSLRLRYRRNESEDWEFAIGGLQRLLIERSARLRISRLKGYDLESEFKLTEDRSQAHALALSKIASEQITGTLFGRISAKTDYSFKLKYQTDKSENVTTRLYSVMPSLRHAVGGKGRLRAEFEIIRVPDKLPTSFYAYKIAEGNTTGWNFKWNVILDYRFNQFISYYVTYFGSDEPDNLSRRTVHEGRAEVRATF